MPKQQLWIPTEIAKHLGVSPHRIRYAIRSRPIKPALAAGDRVFSDNIGLEQIRVALREAESRWQPVLDRGGPALA